MKCQLLGTKISNFQITALSMNTSDHKMSLVEAREIIKKATVNFGSHRLVLLKIPSKTDNPAAREFPYVLKNVLNQHYER